MPILLEDIAEETSASNRRTAKRLEAELRDLEQQRGELAPSQDFGSLAAGSAEQAMNCVIAQVAQVEGIWRGVLHALRNDPHRKDAEQMLQSALKAFESARQLAGHAQSLWDMASAAGAQSNRLEELFAAQENFNKLIAETTKALKHRQNGWQPTDPVRLTLGLQLSKEGKTVKADEARTWFGRGSN